MARVLTEAIDGFGEIMVSFNEGISGGRQSRLVIMAAETFDNDYACPARSITLEGHAIANLINFLNRVTAKEQEATNGNTQRL